MKKIFILMLLTVSGTLAISQSEKFSNSLVWKFYKSGATDTSFIVGTIHLPMKKAFAAVDTVSSLLKKVDRAYFELEYDPIAFATQGMFFIAQQDSEKVKNILSDQEYKLLHKKADELLGEQAIVVDMLKPIGVLSMFALSMVPADTTGAMDILFQMEAKERGVKVGGLETPKEQMEVLKTMTIAQQKEELVDLLTNYEKYTLQFDSLINAYLSHDLELLKKLTNESFSESSQDFKEEILTKRNVKMIDKIDKYASKRSCLFALGAAHLLGDQGLLLLLSSKGYELIPLYNK
jgi:uncharacterized protein YbaP (TraB family)